MIRLLTALARSFGYAAQGIWRSIREERNLRIHLCAVFFVSWFAFLYEIPKSHWLILILLFIIVSALELVNTAVENAVDLSSADRHPLAKNAKDAAAGAVLVAAVGSVVCAGILFSDPEGWGRVGAKLQSPLRLILLLALIATALFFIHGMPKGRSEK